MFPLIVALLCPETLPMPQLVKQPAYFEIRIESKTHCSLYINGKSIKPNVIYETDPLSENLCLELEVRYVDGDMVKSKIFFLDIEPGYKSKFILSIKAIPTLVWC